MVSVAVEDYALSNPAPSQSGLEWLADSQHPLDWNGPTGRTFTRFREEDLDTPIIDLFERVAHCHPNRIAITDADTSLSFQELWDGVSGLAETIAAETRPGDLIGILLPACSMFPLAMLACLAAGRPFVALDPHYPSNWLHQVLEDARPALIIGQQDVTRLLRAARTGWRPAELGVDEPACVVFTSGSTGRPKGIVNSQRNLLQRVAQSINAAHVNAEDKFLTLASLSTIVGVRDIMTALLAGASVHLVDSQRAGAREILNIIRAESITILFAFPALLRSLIAHGAEKAGDALRLVRIGGDVTLWSDIDLLRQWLKPDAAIQLIYAATEAPMMQWFVDDSFRGDDARIPIGYPIPGNRLALIDEYGCATPTGEVGELVVSSPYVALECPDRNDASGCRIFRTGDLVRQRPDGLLERIGRKDRQVKIRGSRVDLDGVEAFLRQHPLVRDAAVLARPGILVAYVSLLDGAPSGTFDCLKEFMRRSAPSSMRPGRFYLIHKIPRLPSSKPDLRALMALDEINVQNEQANLAAAPEAVPAGGDRVVQTAARIWQEVLQMPVGGPQDDFFDAGGDSLKAIRLILGLERALGLELSLTLITEAPKFATLCEALKDHPNTSYVPLVVLKPGDGSPPLFIIHGLGGNVAGLLPMTRRMTYPGAVIGIQARGLAGKDPMHTTVEAMAAEYLQEVKARQPQGPYNLCGYSFGGLVAFEMARRLRESGDEVALVGLFDSMMSPLRWPLRSWLSIVRWRVMRKMAHRGKPIRLLKVETRALLASARYRPGFYPGTLTLFTPSDREPGFPSAGAMWREHAAALSTVEVPGDHWTMFSTPNAGSAAASLTQALALR